MAACVSASARAERAASRSARSALPLGGGVARRLRSLRRLDAFGRRRRVRRGDGRFGVGVFAPRRCARARSRSTSRFVSSTAFVAVSSDFFASAEAILAPDWKNDRSDSSAETRVLSVASRPSALVSASRARFSASASVVSASAVCRRASARAVSAPAFAATAVRASSRADSSSPASSATRASAVCRRPSTRASRAVSSACSSARVAAASSAAAAVAASSAFRSSNAA